MLTSISYLSRNRGRLVYQDGGYAKSLVLFSLSPQSQSESNYSFNFHFHSQCQCPKTNQHAGNDPRGGSHDSPSPELATSILTFYVVDDFNNSLSTVHPLVIVIQPEHILSRINLSQFQPPTPALRNKYGPKLYQDIRPCYCFVHGCFHA